MRLKTALLLLGTLVIVSLLAFWGICWHRRESLPPKPDFADFGRYMTALNLSQNPVAAKIRTQIADGPAALAREKAAAQADGIDLDPAHLQKPLPPAGQNAAPLYIRWYPLVKDSLGLPLYAQPLNNRFAYTAAQLARVQHVLDTHQEAMSLLHQAADRPLCVFKPGEYAQLREAARELETESCLLAHQERYTEAITNQVRGFHIAEQSVNSQPSVYNYLDGDLYIAETTLAGMENILDCAGPNPTVAAQIRQAVIAHYPRVSLKAVIAGEMAHSPQELEKLRTDTPAQLAYYRPASDYVTAGDLPAQFSPTEQQFLDEIVSATEADDLHQLHRMLAAADAAPTVRYKFEAQLAQETALAKADPVHQLSPVTAVTDYLVFDLNMVAEKRNHLDAKEQVLLAGAEALETRGRTGAFPDHLTGSYPDPFAAGRPLLYRREGMTGFVVYSVGPSGTFTGGLPGQHRWDPDQIAFRYPGPTPKAVPAGLLK